MVGHAHGVGFGIAYANRDVECHLVRRSASVRECSDAAATSITYAPDATKESTRQGRARRNRAWRLLPGLGPRILLLTANRSPWG